MAVNFEETMKYGAKILGYVFIVVIIASIFVLPGVMMLTTSVDGFSSITMTASTVAGSVLTFVGSLIFLAGIFGILYKIISDAVEEGTGSSLDGFSESSSEEK